MAADHRRKRPNGSSFAGCSSWEKYKTKKKLESPKYEFDDRSHISLEWDGNLKKVVAKREQIGLRWKDLREFDNPASQSPGILADVIVIPQKLFDIENFTEVLSHEVWQTHLSEKERKYLLQFLPRGSDPEDTVQALLSGDNFHFGNPFLKWGTSLCSGNLHPDALILWEQGTKFEQKMYYYAIKKYHNDMVKYLQKLKEICESSRDPVNEILQKISRSRDVEQQVLSHANEIGFDNIEEDATTTSESCSFIAEDKACSSDNQSSPLTKGVEAQRRVHEKGLTNEKKRKQLLVSDDGKHRKSEKLQKHNIHLNNGDKYMSYLMISKKQHQLVKSMKHSGKSIQSKSLNRVLGSIDTLHVQPYGEFVKEEQKKLQEHWLQLASVDLPAAYENWRERQLERKEIRRSLEQDLKSKLEVLMEDEEKLDDDTDFRDQHEARKHEVEREEKVNNVSILQYENVEGEREVESDEDEEISGDEDALDNQIDLREREYDSNFQDKKKESQGTVPLRDQSDGPGNKESYVEYDKESGSGCPQYQSPQQISSPSGGHDTNPVDADSVSIHVASKADEVSPSICGYSDNANTVHASVGLGGCNHSGDIWPTVGMPHSFHSSAANHEYASTAELSLSHSDNNAPRSQLIDLKSDVRAEESAKDLLQRKATDGSFSSYPNCDQTGLLQSLFKGQDTISYQHEQKQMGVDFQSHNMLIQDGHFAGNLQLHPVLPLEQGQKRHGENYMQESLTGDIYSEGGPYLVPRLGNVPPLNGHMLPINGHFPPVNLLEWPVNTVRMRARLPDHLNNDVLLNQNWYSGEQQVRGGWNSSDIANVPGQSIGNNTDQGSYSVLTHCSQSRSSNHFDMVPPEQLMLPRSYDMASGITSRIGNSLPQATHPLFLSGCDATGSLMPDDIGWMNFAQTSGVHDPVGKSYLRSWNQ